MVTFTCLQCQWTGKKKQVEKHYNKCGGEYFSCVDCGKNFAEDYAQHTSCIDEEDKYHGKWAKSQKKQKNKMNHNKMVQNKLNNSKNANSSKQTRTKRNGKKRTLDEVNADKEIKTNGSNGCPPAKKQKIENVESAKKKSKKKILKQILKSENKATSLKAVCDKFNKEIQIESKEDNSVFLQTLWKISDKVSINTIITNV